MPYKLENMRDKSVLITGGLGFIGSNIAHKCVSLGAKVTIYDACLEPYGWNFFNINEIKGDVEFIKADTRNFDILSKSVAGKDIIFDCAAQISHTISMKDPLLDIDINCKGAMNLLECARRFNDCARIVYAGTRGQIGSLKYKPADENHPTEPVDINGINKLAAEKYFMLYNKIYGIKATSIRINNTYGIRSQMRHGDYSIVNWFIRKALLNEDITIHADGSQTRDYNYVEDVADAMILAGQHPKAIGEIFMLGSGNETRFIDMLNLIVNLTGYKKKITSIQRPKDRESIEIGDFFVSFAKIRRALGWEPKTGLEDGILKTINFYRENLKEYLG